MLVCVEALHSRHRLDAQELGEHSVSGCGVRVGLCSRYVGATTVGVLVWEARLPAFTSPRDSFRWISGVSAESSLPSRLFTRRMRSCTDWRCFRASLNVSLYLAMSMLLAPQKHTARHM